MSLFSNQKIGVAFCSPHRKIKLANGQEIVDTITVQWHRQRASLAYGTNINYVEFFCDGLEIGVARTRAARRACEHKPRPLYLFFLDDDVLPNYDAFTKLFFRAQTNPHYDIFAGVYCTKGGNPPDPLIYQGDGGGPFWDWAVGDLLTTEQHGITGVHMGLTLVRTSLFQRMVDAGVASFEEDADDALFRTVKGSWKTPEGCMQSRSGTEDLWFCQLAQKVGAKLMIDTSVLAGHIDKETGVTWGLPDNSPPVVRAKWLGARDRKEAAAEGNGHGPLKLALDVGAGNERRQWAGHKTYTLDLDADVKPDYVQDIRHLNLPDDHFDLVASSHAFEHVPRFEQSQVWSEAYRVCKPGGALEVMVPSLEWAAAKVADGQVDEHVMNVLYGAQEAHGYARELNLHYFAYTKDVGKALAEEAGFVDVGCRDWRDDPNLVLNLVITGRKPGGEEKNDAVAVAADAPS